MKIVVLSKGYEATLGIGRSLSAANYHDIDLVYVGNNNPEIVMSSNLFSRIRHIPRRDDRTVIDALLSDYGLSDSQEKTFLFSTDDYTTSLIDRHCDELKDLFLMTHVEGYRVGAITHLMDKGYQMSIAPDFGLNVAETWQVCCVNGEYMIPGDVVYPCIVKPEVSAEGAAKLYIKTCASEKELRSHLDDLVKKRVFNNLLIQRLITIDSEYDIHGICIGKEVCIPVAHKKQVTATYTKGVTVVGQLIDPEELEPAMAKLRALLASLDFYGLVDVELYRSRDAIYLNEINLRAAGTCWAATHAGANLPGKIVQSLSEGAEAVTFGNIAFGDTFVNEKTAYEEVVYGHIPYRKLKVLLHSGFGLIRDDNDTRPWKAFNKSMYKSMIRMTVKRLLHRA